MGPLDLGHRWAPWPHEDSRESWPLCGPRHTAVEPAVALEEAFEDPLPIPSPLPHTQGVERSPSQNAPVPL